MPMPTEDHVSRLIAALVDEHGYDLEGVDVTPAEPHRCGGSSSACTTVRVVVDRDDGVDLEAIAELSRELSAALDVAGEPAAGPYTLEVTTPGVDRPLTRERHWRRARGRRVRMTVEGRSTIGRVAAVYRAASGHEGVADTVDLIVSDKEGPTVRSMALSEIDRAVVQVEFAPPSPRELALVDRTPCDDPVSQPRSPTHPSVETAGVNEE